MRGRFDSGRRINGREVYLSTAADGRGIYTKRLAFWRNKDIKVAANFFA